MSKSNQQIIQQILQAESELYTCLKGIKNEQEVDDVIQAFEKKGVLMSRVKPCIELMNKLEVFYSNAIDVTEIPDDNYAVDIRNQLKNAQSHLHKLKSKAWPTTTDEAIKSYQSEMVQPLIAYYKNCLHGIDRLESERLDNLKRSIQTALSETHNSDLAHEQLIEHYQTQFNFYNDLLEAINQGDKSLYSALLTFNQYNMERHSDYQQSANTLSDEAQRQLQTKLTHLKDYLNEKRQEDDDASTKFAVIDDIIHNLFNYLTSTAYSRTHLQQCLQYHLGEAPDQSRDDKRQKHHLFYNWGHLGKLGRILRELEQLTSDRGVLPDSSPTASASEQIETTQSVFQILGELREQLKSREYKVGSDPFAGLKERIDDQKQQLVDIINDQQEELKALHQQRQRNSQILYEQYPYFMDGILPQGYRWLGLSESIQTSIIDIINEQDVFDIMSFWNNLFASLQSQAKQACDAMIDFIGTAPSYSSSATNIACDQTEHFIEQELDSIKRNSADSLLARLNSMAQQSSQDKIKQYRSCFKDYVQQTREEVYFYQQIQQHDNKSLPINFASISRSSFNWDNTALSRQLAVRDQEIEDIQRVVVDSLNQYKEQFNQDQQDLDSWMAKRQPDYQRLQQAHGRAQAPSSVGGLVTWLFNEMTSSWSNKKQPYSLQVMLMDQLSSQIGPDFSVQGTYKQAANKASFAEQTDQRSDKSAPSILKNYIKKLHADKITTGQPNALIDNVVDIVYDHLLKNGNTWQKGRYRSKRNVRKAGFILNSFNNLLSAGSDMASITRAVQTALNDANNPEQQQHQATNSEVNQFVCQVRRRTGFFECSSSEARTAQKLRDRLDQVVPQA